MFYWAVVWHSTGASPYRCVYGDAICSLTVATWLLCGVTGLAFLAAYKAARWALRTYEIAFETLQMEQSRAFAERHTQTTGEGRVHQAHVKLRDGKLELGVPDPDERTAFVPEDCEFESLGRAALIDVRIVLRVKFLPKLGLKDQTLSVPVGNLRDQGITWARLWIEGQALMTLATFGWDQEGATSKVDDEDKKLLFRPLPQRATRARLVISTDAGAARRAPAPPLDERRAAERQPVAEPPSRVTEGPVKDTPSEEDTSGAAAAAAAESIAVAPQLPRKGRATDAPAAEMFSPLRPPSSAPVASTPDEKIPDAARGAQPDGEATGAAQSPDREGTDIAPAPDSARTGDQGADGKEVGA